MRVEDASRSSTCNDTRRNEVTFKDGRTLKGRSPDFTAVAKVFTLYPEPRQGNIERVVVFKEATDEVH